MSLGGTVPEDAAPEESTAKGGTSRFSTYQGSDAAVVGRELSKPAMLKREKTDLSGLTVRERTKIRKESMTAGDSWEDLHGTKDRPAKQFVRNWAKKAKKKTAAAAGSAAASVRRASLLRRMSERRRSGVPVAAPAAAPAAEGRRESVEARLQRRNSARDEEAAQARGALDC